jgi:prepilin-type N-terminal cleavage/methylation domain-containing protein
MKARISNLKRKRGFTLLEVVVAMTIVGLGVVTLLEIFSAGLRLSGRSSAKTEAITWGTRVMDEVLIRRAIREGEEEGPFGQQGRWRLQVKPRRDETRTASPGDWELKEITLDIPYSGSERGKRLEMRTLRLMKKERP